MFLQGEQWLWWSHPINSPRFTVQNGWRVCEKDAHFTSRLPDASPPASVSWAPCADRNHHPCFSPESVTLENNRTRVSFSLTHEPYRNSQNTLRYWICLDSTAAASIWLTFTQKSRIPICKTFTVDLFSARHQTDHKFVFIIPLKMENVGERGRRMKKKRAREREWVRKGC